jgi:DNA polymerase-3 subunit alpha
MVLIIDTETNGLPDMKYLPWGKYPYYKDMEKYDNARIVQITIMICDDDLNPMEIKDFIIKRDNFSIDNYQFHGITNEISDNVGISFIDVMNQLSDCIKREKKIIAHNIDFDINVILAECHRYGLNDLSDDILRKQHICSMKSTKSVLKIINKYGRFKNPSLAELYYFNFNQPIENAHNSKYDVINLHKVLKYMYDNGTFAI